MTVESRFHFFTISPSFLFSFYILLHLFLFRIHVLVCDKVNQLLAHGLWFSSASSTTKTGRHDSLQICCIIWIALPKGTVIRKVEDTKSEGQSEEKGQKDKQRSTEHRTENQR